MKKAFLILSCIICIILTACGVDEEAQLLSDRYDHAITKYENGKYLEAQKIFELCGDYKDAAEWIEQCKEMIQARDAARAQESNSAPAPEINKSGWTGDQYSYSKEPTETELEDSWGMAERAIEEMYISYEGLINYLINEGGFSEDCSIYVANQMTCDWDYNAYEIAESLASDMYSRSDVIYMLINEYGFTRSQAENAADMIFDYDEDYDDYDDYEYDDYEDYDEDDW